MITAALLALALLGGGQQGSQTDKPDTSRAFQNIADGVKLKKVDPPKPKTAPLTKEQIVEKAAQGK